MHLPEPLFREMLKCGSIFYFVNRYFLKNSSQPHPHVCVYSGDDMVVIMMCGTSSRQSSERHFERNGIPSSCLPWIKPDGSKNKLAKDTYINCCKTFEFTVSELYSIYLGGDLDAWGDVSDSELYQIKQGILDSPVLEEDIKELILGYFPEF